jgi:large subunit ribosomal protein L18
MKTVKRRRKEGKTDYQARLIMLKGERPRVIFRKTNKYVIGQYVKSEEAQDKVIVGVSSKQLEDYGWPKEAKGSLKSLPASYLTGLLLGKKIISKKEKGEAIFDIGLLRNIPKSRVYAFLKGVIDSGINLKCNEKIFPDEKRIKGEHLKNSIPKIFNTVKSKIEKS